MIDSKQIAHIRLVNQRLTTSSFKKTEELVSWMGCIQAQDFASAKWAIANRIKGITDQQIEADFNAGKILRTHVLRPTWHFVCPEDIGWMLQLTAPHVKAMSKSMHRQLGIDETTLRKSKEVLTKALSAGKHLTRQQLLPFYTDANINTDDIRLGIILMDAELDGLICSGALQGKQFTYALLDERLTKTTPYDREIAIAELAKRYFSSHGPATIQDFAWWSGLNLADSKHGLEMNKHHLTHHIVNAQAYWFAADTTAIPIAKSVQLLPAFDEYTIAYKYRGDVLPTVYNKETGNGIFKPLIIADGEVAGIWKRSLTKTKVLIDLMPFKPIDKSSQLKLLAEAKRYSKFLNLDLQITGLEVVKP
jgi:hypothetical protein